MPAKTMKTIKMYGYTREIEPAQTHNADEVIGFTDANKSMYAVVRPDRVFLKCGKKHYQLHKHKSANRYQGELDNGIKAHFTCQKITGKLIYWA